MIEYGMSIGYIDFMDLSESLFLGFSTLLLFKKEFYYNYRCYLSFLSRTVL